jgi:formate hydrogenlyase subunit 4
MLPDGLIPFFQMGLYLCLAPAVAGLLRWFKTRWQARRGADIWQPYRDLLKLLRKQPNLPESASWVFTLAPPVIFVCYLLPGLFLPLIYVSPGGSMDFLLLSYLLGLAKFMSGLAVFDVSSNFGPLSSARQFLIHMLAEPVLLVIVYALALLRYSSSLSGLTEPGQSGGVLEIVTNPAIGLMGVALCYVFLAESGRLPFDNLNTHLELAMIEAGTQLEYSGRALALIEWAQALKLTFFLSLLAAMVCPYPLAIQPHWAALLIGLLAYLVKMTGLIFGLALWELTQAKLRLWSVVNPLTTAMVLALTAVVFVVASTYLRGG